MLPSPELLEHPPCVPALVPPWGSICSSFSGHTWGAREERLGSQGCCRGFPAAGTEQGNVEEFPPLHIWLEFHRWSLPAHHGGRRCRSPRGLGSRAVDPSAGAGRRGSGCPFPPRWGLQSPSQLPSSQPSPADHPGVLGSPLPPPDPPLVPPCHLHPPHRGCFPPASFHAGHHLRPPLPRVRQGWGCWGCSGRGFGAAQ